MVRTILNLSSVDAGFNRAAAVDVRRRPAQRQLRRRRPTGPASTSGWSASWRALPGVQGATAMSGLPPQRDVDANDTDFESFTAPKEGPFENVDYYQTVGADYFETMGIPIVDGRGFAGDRRRRRAGGDRQRDVRADVLPGSQPARPAACASASAIATRGSPSSASPRTSSRAASIRRPAPSCTSYGPQAIANAQLFAPRRCTSSMRSDLPPEALASAVGGRGPERRRGAAVRAAAGDGRGVRRVDPPAAAAGAAARHLRRPGAAAGRDRHLRRAGLHGHRAAPRDRHPHGAGGRPGHGGRRRHAPGTEPGRRRHRRRAGGGARPRPARRVAALRRRAPPIRSRWWR